MLNIILYENNAAINMKEINIFSAWIDDIIYAKLKE